MTQLGRHDGIKQRRPPTPGQAIRRFCMECLCVASGRQAYDCLCVWPPACPLYPAHPFRGKPMPAKIAPKVTGEAAEFVATEQAELEALAAEIPRRRPSAALIRRRCRDCHPEGGDCEMADCPLYPWNPRGKGQRPKRVMSATRRQANAANLLAAQKARSASEKTDQKASLADVALSETNAATGPISDEFMLGVPVDSGPVFSGGKS